MKKFVIACLFLSNYAAAISLSKDNELHLEECSVLLEQMSNSNCGQKTLHFFKDAYIKIGGSVAKRSMSFEEKRTTNKVFEMEGDYTPAPVFSISLGDNYFKESNFGYQLGFIFFRDSAYRQLITRGQSDKTADIATYTKMQVVAFSPTMFYSFGREDGTPNNHLTFGIGVNLGYSSVKGTAYLTEDESNEACFDAGTDFVNGNGLKQNITQNCEFEDYDSDDLGWGVQLYVAYQYNNWLTELSNSTSSQNSNGGYRFTTREFSIGLSRKFGF